MTSYIEQMGNIKAFVFDVDGVLTNGHVVLMPDGQQLRYVHSRDGYAIQLAVKKGYYVAAISGGNSEPMKERLRKLGMTDIYMKVAHKDEAMDDFRHACHLEIDEILYMVDDIPDLPLMHTVGFPCCPADAAPEVMDQAIFISQRNGGEGCVREVIENCMRLHGKWYDPGKK